MPENVTSELIYEVLKQLQVGQAEMKADIREMKARITSIDTRLGLVHTDMAHLA